MPLIFVVNKRHSFQATDQRRPATDSRVHRAARARNGLSRVAQVGLGRRTLSPANLDNAAYGSPPSVDAHAAPPILSESTVAGCTCFG
jgi:hypothetical protein